MLLIFKLPQPVGTFLLRLIFTGNVDGVFLLIKRIDFMGHKVGNFFSLSNLTVLMVPSFGLIRKKGFSMLLWRVILTYLLHPFTSLKMRLNLFLLCV